MLCAGRSLRQLRVSILAGRGHYVARGAQAVSLRCPTTDFRPPHRHVEGRRGKRAMATSSAPPPPPPLRFHTFDVGSQVFVERPHTLALVNLKPIVPLHTLVIPRTPYKRLTDIPRGGPALHELFDTVQDIVQMCQSLTGAPACTVAIQDGAEAGQSVPHLHVHVLPRKAGDFEPNDAIYPHLEAFGLGLHKAMTGSDSASDSSAAGGAPNSSTRDHRSEPPQPSRSIVPDDENRPSRSPAEMAQEAAWLRTEFQRHFSGAL